MISTGQLNTAVTSVWAAAPDVNGGGGTSLGTVNVLLIFVVAPVTVLLLIAAVYLRPGSAPGAQRYRPNRGWSAEPTWIGVPSREVHGSPALEGAGVLRDQAALTAPEAEESTAVSSADPSVGGARGSW